MSCTGCQPTKPILNCIETIVIGALEPSVQYLVYFENASNGKVNVSDPTSAAAITGLLTLTINFVPIVGTEYKVWVTQANATNVDAREVITIDGAEYECLFVTFKRIYGTDNATITATNQALSI